MAVVPVDSDLHSHDACCLEAHWQTYVQVLGGLAILLRCFVLQQLLMGKHRSGTNTKGSASASLLPNLRLLMPNLPFVSGFVSAKRRSSVKQRSTLLDPAALQRRLQAFPRVLVAPSGRLRSPQAVARRLLAAACGRQDANTAERAAMAATAPALATVDLFSDDGLGLEKPANQGTGVVPSVTDKALTSVDRAGLFAASVSTGFLQSAFPCPWTFEFLACRCASLSVR